MTNPIEMERGEFVDWAVQAFGVDEDDVSFWDMQRDLDSKKPMPTDFEVSQEGVIPTELYTILIARKAARPAPIRKPFVVTDKPSEWEARGSKDGE